MKIIALIIPVLALSCSLGNNTNKDIVKNNFDFAETQLHYAIQETEKKISTLPDAPLMAEYPYVGPRSIEDNELLVVRGRDWTSGFFPGELWYTFEYTSSPQWEEKAREYTSRLEQVQFNHRTHDVGFVMYCSYGNGYRLTGDQKYRDILIQTAKTLANRFSPVVGAIRSWDHSTEWWDYPVIIDNMMNLELLYWAFRETGDSLFYNVATTHALTTLKNHFRDDYSSFHVIGYDPVTGEVVAKNTHQGYAHESSWSRGQAWAIYGYTMCFRETGKQEFLDNAVGVTNFIFSHENMPEDLIPYWDYNAPEIPNEPRDVSAATVTASALYELSMYDKANSELHKKRADTILDNLTKNYRAEAGSDFGFLLLNSTGSKPHDSEIDVPLVYADYYFLEALLRKHKLETKGTVF